MNKTKIVLVEDDEVLGKVMYEELIAGGFDVSRAMDGEAGLALINEKKPDLVLLDLLMPKMDGFTVLEKVKQSPVTRNIPVIILSMLNNDEDLKRGMKLGADDYLVKSQHAIGEIIEKVNAFLANPRSPKA
jgi:DNA-binding response OmpR family regulator